EFIYGGNLGGHINDKIVDNDQTSNGSIVTTSTNPSFGLKGMYKINSSGAVEWEFNALGNNSIYSFLSTVVDEYDNIYSLLYYDTTPNTSWIVNGMTYYAGITLVKIDSNGSVLWTRKIGALESSGSKILYKNGNLYIAGQFSGQLNINNEINLTSQSFFDCFSWIYRSGNDFYLTKFTTSGTLINAISFGEDYPDYLVDVTIDDFQNIYL